LRRILGIIPRPLTRTEKPNCLESATTDTDQSVSLDKAQAHTVIAEVAQTIARWPEFAESADVPAIDAARINRVLRTLLPS